MQEVKGFKSPQLHSQTWRLPAGLKREGLGRRRDRPGGLHAAPIRNRPRRTVRDRSTLPLPRWLGLHPIRVIRRCLSL
jgi:hypothetical protein